MVLDKPGTGISFCSNNPFTRRVPGICWKTYRYNQALDRIMLNNKEITSHPMNNEALVRKANHFNKKITETQRRMPFSWSEGQFADINISWLVPFCVWVFRIDLHCSADKDTQKKIQIQEEHEIGAVIIIEKNKWSVHQL